MSSEQHQSNKKAIPHELTELAKPHPIDPEVNRESSLLCYQSKVVLKWADACGIEVLQISNAYRMVGISNTCVLLQLPMGMQLSIQTNPLCTFQNFCEVLLMDDKKQFKEEMLRDGCCFQCPKPKHLFQHITRILNMMHKSKEEKEQKEAADQ